MTLYKLSSVVVDGVSAESVPVEVDVLYGLPSFTVVGLADKALQYRFADF